VRIAEEYHGSEKLPEVVRHLVEVVGHVDHPARETRSAHTEHTAKGDDLRHRLALVRLHLPLPGRGIRNRRDAARAGQRLQRPCHGPAPVGRGCGALLQQGDLHRHRESRRRRRADSVQAVPPEDGLVGSRHGSLLMDDDEEEESKACSSIWRLL
jgi:hypothetical protein